MLRAAAALLVVAGHGQTAAAGLAAARGHPFARTTVLPWGAGVDLFFVISGFIMVYASRRLFGRPGAWSEFLRRRITRVAPLYWACTTLYLAILLAAHLKGDPRMPGAAATAASFLFIPYAGSGAGEGAFPVFDLGWTLNYEMFFYALFACAVGLRRGAAVALVLAALAALALWGALAHPASTALRFWTRPVILDFGLGAAVGAARSAGAAWPANLRRAAFALGAAVFVLDPLRLYAGSGTVANGFPRVLQSGLPAALVLAALVLGPAPVVASPRLRRGLAPFAAAAVGLGNASYSLYLVHPFVLIAAEKLASKTAVAERIGYGTLTALIVAGSVVAARLAFKGVEEPLTRLALRLTDRWALPGAGPVTAPAPAPFPARPT